jgi:hypothetical protein
MVSDAGKKLPSQKIEEMLRDRAQFQEFGSTLYDTDVSIEHEKLDLRGTSFCKYEVFGAVPSGVSVSV